MARRIAVVTRCTVGVGSSGSVSGWSSAGRGSFDLSMVISRLLMFFCYFCRVMFG